MALAYSSGARGGGLKGMVGRGRSDWDRMMSSFTVGKTTGSTGGGNRAGSFAARYNAARLSNTIGQISRQQSSARQANIARRGQIEGIYGKMMGMVSPGGAFEKRGLADIARQKTQTVGKETQGLISGGMFGTTTTAGLGRKFEANVGAPARLRLEDIMQQRQLGVMGQKAGFLERIEDVYPDYSSLLQMLAR